jgi:hypothetical protein
MTFGLDKCAILLITNGKYSTTNIYPEIPKLDDEDNKGYRYLGVMEGVDFHMKEVKEMTKKEYISRVPKILNADMIREYTMHAIRAFVLPVLRYTFGTIKWTKGKFRSLDVKTRKMLTMKGIHHPKGNVHCLYLHRSKGGRGLMGVEDTHNCKCAALAKYVIHSDDPLTQMVQNTPTPTQKFLMKYAAAPKFMTPDMTDDNHQKGLNEKPLHGKFFCQQAEIPQVDIEQSHLWLRQAQIRPETKAAICAAQEQTMVTNHIRKEIFKQVDDPLCCLCSKENKTISHIVSGCKMLAGTKYTKRHNKFCQYLHWCILQDFHIPVNPNWQ